MSTQMPAYMYSPNTAAAAQADLACATRKLSRCEHRVHICRSGSDRREALRALRSAQRQLAAAETRLAAAEDKNPNGVTL